MLIHYTCTFGHATYEKSSSFSVWCLKDPEIFFLQVSLSRGGQKAEEMRKEVLRLQKDLLTERNKVRALQNEVENPLNVHR